MACESGVDENGATYAENARLKAEAAVAKTGIWAIGDDSGLEVDALNGFPGLHSARLAPTQRERTAELLRRLEGVPRPWPARFVCVIALAGPDGATTFHGGEAAGEIVPEWRGTAGFGYDPMFLPDGHTRTFGDMTADEKHGLPPKGQGLSHRARAFLKLAAACLRR